MMGTCQPWAAVATGEGGGQRELLPSPVGYMGSSPALSMSEVCGPQSRCPLPLPGVF